MADAQVVLCDPLCFIVNKCGKTDVKALNSALFDFYSTDILSDAKKRLLEDVDKLNLKSNRPHIPHRRDGDGRLQKEGDDLLLLLTYLDEQKALDIVRGLTRLTLHPPLKLTKLHVDCSIRSIFSVFPCYH